MPQATYPNPARAAPLGFLFGLAPGGVYPAITVTSNAVRSYRTISPLPARWRYIFCGTCHRLASSRRYLAPCPTEPGLSSQTPDKLLNRVRAIAQLARCAFYTSASTGNSIAAIYLTQVFVGIAGFSSYR
jgi:hypothetical protein